MDLLVAATENDIREQFRRINSYNVPLNPQEKRHAVWQGEFKWFIVELSKRYSQALKDIGVFTESQLSRMNDAALFTEMSLALLKGIQSASETKNDALYREMNVAFKQKPELDSRIDGIFDAILGWPEIHHTDLLTAYNFYSLGLAITHVHISVDVLESLFPHAPILGTIGPMPRDIILANLGSLAGALENPEQAEPLREFVLACSKATNRVAQRQTRFTWFCHALSQSALP